MKYQLAIFDMDGTLTVELLDFKAIRRDLGLPMDDLGIVEHVERMDPVARKRATEILATHEKRAADNCGAYEGGVEVLEMLRRHGVKTALLTRNSAASARRILERHGLKLDRVFSRENPPYKPHPDSILNITRSFAIEPKKALMIGDYLYDLEAAKAAGTDCALICHQPELPVFAARATYTVRRLAELLGIFELNGQATR